MVGNELGDDAPSPESAWSEPNSGQRKPDRTVGDITQILSQIEQGDGQAAEQLLPLVYDPLRKLAAAKMAQEKPGQTLQATELVHEAYIRLVVGKQAQNWDSRYHFFSAAAEAMRRILVDSARRKERPKHGGDRMRVDLDEAATLAPAPNDEIVALDEAMTKFAQFDRESAELVNLRYFGGLSVPQIAELLGVSSRTVDRRWAYARAWLRQELYAD
jgi:RNA polymerase sigma factor (TIGR02999 family)